jgi:hypothetical protein
VRRMRGSVRIGRRTAGGRRLDHRRVGVSCEGGARGRDAWGMHVGRAWLGRLVGLVCLGDD